MAAADRLPVSWTLWRAARPSQLGLIFVVYALGAGAARALDPVGAVEWRPLLAGAAALIPVAVSVHHANEYADVETDRLTDRTPFSGGSGALERTGVDRSVLARGSAGALAVAVLATVLGHETGTLSGRAVGLLAVIAVAGLSYSLPPVALVRRGLGELTNALLGGFCLPLYGAAVVGPVSTETVLAVVPFTLLVGCNLLATHWPDRAADAAVGKRTLAVRWRPERLRRGYWLLAGAAVATSLGLWVRYVPTVVIAGQALALPPLVWGGVVLTRQRSPFPAVSAMVLYGGASAVAWWCVALW